MSELYTLKEVADRLRSGKRTVERLIASGELRSVKVGRRRLVPDEALEQFVKSAMRRGRVA
jgi:excisionase family DNA binding protein